VDSVVSVKRQSKHTHTHSLFTALLGEPAPEK